MISIPARRGNIYDRDNTVLASSSSYMNVQVYLEEIEDKQALAITLAELFNREDILRAMEEEKAKVTENSIDEKIQNYIKSQAAAVPAADEERRGKGRRQGKKGR